jgi:hypothetical protein
MLRDMDLIRNILLYIEERYKAGTDTIKVHIEGFPDSVVYEHCKLMQEAELIQKLENRGCDGLGDQVYVGNLTNEGYDYIDKIKDISLWGKVKGIINAKGLPLIISTVKTIADTLVKSLAEGVANSIIKNIQ